jgi:hypothetical protein
VHGLIGSDMLYVTWDISNAMEIIHCSTNIQNVELQFLISRLKNLSKEFEVKDLGQLKYFLGIEIARSPKGIVFSQRKYDLDLLSDTGTIGYRAVSTPIDQNHKLCAHARDTVDRESYQKLVGCLLYLCHTGPDMW